MSTFLRKVFMSTFFERLPCRQFWCISVGTNSSNPLGDPPEISVKTGKGNTQVWFPQICQPLPQFLQNRNWKNIPEKTEIEHIEVFLPYFRKYPRFFPGKKCQSPNVPSKEREILQKTGFNPLPDWVLPLFPVDLCVLGDTFVKLSQSPDWIPPLLPVDFCLQRLLSFNCRPHRFVRCLTGLLPSIKIKK